MNTRAKHSASNTIPDAHRLRAAGGGVSEQAKLFASIAQSVDRGFRLVLVIEWAPKRRQAATVQIASEGLVFFIAARAAGNFYSRPDSLAAMNALRKVRCFATWVQDRSEVN